MRKSEENSSRSFGLFEHKIHKLRNSPLEKEIPFSDSKVGRG